MTNPMFNPQPNYSGVTIQIANPSVNVGQPGSNAPCVNGNYCGNYQNGLPNYANNYATYPQNVPYNAIVQPATQYPAVSNQNTGYPSSYPAQYYLNNYNYPSGNGNNGDQSRIQNDERFGAQNNTPLNQDETDERITANSYKMYANQNKNKINDMSKSDNIKEDLAQREAEINEEKKNTKETKIVALTDEYIKSLENYLNNPNDEIRLMASKEILTRLDEDKDRYDDAALNALLNKMMQDPNKLVRIAALSAFSSQLASGNDYTVKLLHNIQSNPNSDKEDVLQAADILLKMSAGVEVKNIPNPSVKDKKEQ